MEEKAADDIDLQPARRASNISVGRYSGRPSYRGAGTRREHAQIRDAAVGAGLHSGKHKRTRIDELIGALCAQQTWTLEDERDQEQPW